jgi:hypothetical protein
LKSQEAALTTPQKTNALQAYQIVLYDRALHPELFALKGRRVVRQGQWELEAWVMQGQHVLRFERGAVCVSELVTDQETGLPTTGAVAAFLCAGERDYEHTFGGKAANGAGESGGTRGSVVYMSTVQTESLSENLYIATCDELSAHARENGSLVHPWEEDSGRGLSILDVQRYANEVHSQAYHLLPTGGVVIRTQTIFEIS